MRARRIGTIVGLIALVLLLGRTVHELPERYRVEYDVPPVEAALWFASRYPEYFKTGEEGLDAWLDSLPARDRVFVLAMSQTLAWAWVEHEVERFDAQDPTGLAREVTIVLRHKTLNQLEFDLESYAEAEGMQMNAYTGDPRFAAGVFARLVRGASNCEGQNHLAALLLESALEPIPDSSFDADMVGVPSHDLVRLSGRSLAQPIYVDAWSNLPAFTVDPSQPGDAPLLGELGDSPPPVVPGAASQAPFEAAAYQAGEGVSIVMLPERHAPTKPVSLKIRAPALDEDSLARVKDPWKIYLYARILHVYDDPRAADVYRFLLERQWCEDERPPGTFLCVAGTKLLERLESAEEVAVTGS
jgi:hypothetical protein